MVQYRYVLRSDRHLAARFVVRQPLDAADVSQAIGMLTEAGTTGSVLASPFHGEDRF
jgi:hypothetical protein